MDLTGLSPQEAWAAGLFDGEGSIGCHSAGGATRRLVMQIAMCDREPLELMLSLFGGILSGPWANGEGRKPRWMWQLRGLQARPAMERILPGLCPRRQRQYADALTKWKEYSNGKRSNRGPARGFRDV